MPHQPQYWHSEAYLIGAPNSAMILGSFTILLPKCLCIVRTAPIKSEVISHALSIQHLKWKNITFDLMSMLWESEGYTKTKPQTFAFISGESVVLGWLVLPIGTCICCCHSCCCFLNPMFFYSFSYFTFSYLKWKLCYNK